MSQCGYSHDRDLLNGDFYQFVESFKRAWKVHKTQDTASRMKRMLNALMDKEVDWIELLTGIEMETLSEETNDTEA